MQDCIFCEISSGRSPSHRVFEDEYSFAFLDKHPINPGHLLVVPKKHVADFYDLDWESFNRLMATVKKLSATVATAIKPHKVGLVAAGFDVPHTHIHIIPMHEYHDITSRAYLERGPQDIPVPTDEEQIAIIELLNSSLVSE